MDYAVTVEVDAAGVSNELLDYLTVQSSLVENLYQEVKELPVHPESGKMKLALLLIILIVHQQD